MPNLPTLEITLPVLNEEKTLRVQVTKIKKAMEGLPYVSSWRLVIADNGSTDRTAQIGRALALEDKSVSYIRLDRKGVGLALKTSWGASGADLVGYMDLDLATDLAHLPQALKALTEEKFDLVYGTRLHPQSIVTGRKPTRTFVSRVFNMMLQQYLQVKFSDGMCGFKFLWRKHLPMLEENGAISDGWFFSTELLVVAEWLGLRLRELPVRWTDDPDSHVRVIPLALSYMRAMRVLKAKRRMRAQAA